VHDDKRVGRESKVRCIHGPKALNRKLATVQSYCGVSLQLEDVTPITVPNVIGLGKPDADTRLKAALLRYIARYPFAASGDGKATEQSPAAGTLVPSFTIVTVSYPSPLGPYRTPRLTGRRCRAARTRAGSIAFW
jgi:PASTA domain